MANKPQMKQVMSSSIRALGYDDEKRELHVEFKSGHYVYIDVPFIVFDVFNKSQSKGKFLNEIIKPTFRYKRLVEVAAGVYEEYRKEVLPVYSNLDMFSVDKNK